MTDRISCRFLFLLLAVLLISSCAVLPEAREREMGKQEAEKIEEKVGIYDSKPYRNYVSSVGNRLALYTSRTNLEYEFEILDTFLVNALALPGGFVYVTRGLLKELDTEAELAAILAHELGHVNARHAEKRRQIQMVTLLAGLAAAPATGGKSLIGGVIGQDMAARGYTREAEYEADKLGLKYLLRAGYDPSGLTDSLERLQDLNGRIPDYEILILRTHPYLIDRIRQIDLQKFTSRYPERESYSVNKNRYQRYRRRHIFRDKEKKFLARLDGFLKCYQAMDIVGSKEFLHDDFEFQYEDSSGKEALENWLGDKFEETEEIKYDYRLLNLDVSDTETTVIYTFKEENWFPEEEYPHVNSGQQKMVWRVADERWKLMKLH